MRTTTPFSALALAAFLALGACTGDAAPGSETQEGDAAVQGAGATPDRGAASAARDTTPHRPGTGTGQEP
jgi:hypothetical protein